MELKQQQHNLPSSSSSSATPYQRHSSPFTVRVRRKNLANLATIGEKLSAIFGVQLQEAILDDDQQQQQQQQTQHPFISFLVLDESTGCQVLASTTGANGGDLIAHIQQFIDSLCTNEAEDSSYDSDCDGEDLSHEQVSRTTSDTLGQEFAEYVNTAGGNPLHQQQQQQQQHHLHHHHHQQHQLGKGDVGPAPTTTTTTTTALPEHSPGYQQRVEFALKLGYTERLVQAALQRLGPNPAQNELLAELIKLGSQPGAKGGNEFSLDHHHALLHGGGEPTIGGGGPPVYYPLVTVGGGSTGGDLVGSTAVAGLPSIATGASAGTIGGSGGSEVETLRSIVIDGSNVAMSHGNKEVFSCRGIRLCVDWFKNRGHKEITVFVPKWRKESSRPDNPVKDGEILNELEKERMLVFTPSRLVGGKRMVCYDDRYILKLAAENDGIVVSNDNYRDLVQESSEFKKVVEERVLMYSFVNDRFMPPDDPLGRSGPTLDNFLRVQPRKGDPPPPCPYGKKCTYGNKCKFYHPERGSQPHKSVTERLSEYAARHLQARSGLDPSGAAAGATAPGSGRSAVQGKSLSVPLSNSSSETSPINDKRKALCRTRSNVPSDSGTAGNNNPYVGGTDHMMLHAGHPHHPGVRPPQPPQQMPFLAPPPPPGAVVSNRGSHAWDLSAQQQQQQPHGHGSMVDVQPIFPKSHSIENISNEPYVVVGGGSAAAAHHSAVGCYGAPPMWQQQQQQLAPPPPPSQQSSQQQHTTAAGGGSVSQPTLPHDTVEHGGVDSVNLHRKLQRQLTLNPAGCDPRIYQMQRHHQQQQQSQQSQSSPQQQQQQQQLSPHRPLAPSLSGGARPSPPSQWELHQHVQRIASAPDSVRPWHSGPPPASSSEPHINLGWSPNPVPPAGLTPSNSHSVVSQQHHQQQQQQHHQQQHQQHQHDRQRLHYHLASIFPEEQVQTVMQMYPDETNPQKICAAILAMFPKM